MAGKTFVPQFIVVVEHLCRYYTTHYDKILAALTAVLPGPDKVTVIAGMTALKAVCDILQANKASF